MNERIKELVLQAGSYVNEVYTLPVRSKTPGKIWEDGHIDWQTQFNQKFAELIVQKLDDILVLEYLDCVGNKDKKAEKRVQRLREKVKTYFGVE